MPLLFSVSGLRGIAGQDLIPQSIQRYAHIFGHFIGSGTVLIGRDTRTSSPSWCRAVTAGLIQAGCRVIDLGIVPTPTVVYMVRATRAKAGIIITASHNPDQWNALKFVMTGGRFLNKKELERFKRLLGKKSAVGRKKKIVPGKVQKRKDAIDLHIKRILTLIKVKSHDLSVGIDAVNGAGSKALPRLARAAGCTVYTVNCTHRMPFPRGPEPIPENLYQLKHLVRVARCDVGFACDPDCDRLAIIDENGEAIGEDMSLVFVAEHILKQRKGPIVTNFSTTSLMEHVSNTYNCSLLRTKVGEAHVVEGMERTGAVLGGEGNGGIIDPRINMTRDALVGAAHIIALLAERKESVSRICASYPKVNRVKVKLKIPAERFIRKQERVRAMLKGRTNTRDGLRITARDYWVHIRPSNTEPLVRIIGESSEPAVIERVIQQIKRILS